MPSFVRPCAATAACSADCHGCFCHCFAVQGMQRRRTTATATSKLAWNSTLLRLPHRAATLVRLPNPAAAVLDKCDKKRLHGTARAVSSASARPHCCLVLSSPPKPMHRPLAQFVLLDACCTKLALLPLIPGQQSPQCLPAKDEQACSAVQPEMRAARLDVLPCALLSSASTCCQAALLQRQDVR